MFKVLAKWQKKEAEMADYCGFAVDHQVPDGPYLLFKNQPLTRWGNGRFCQ
jgi:hypothetical protein